MSRITIALSKGRTLGETLPLLAAAGIAPAEDLATTRKLVVATSRAGVELLLLRAADVPTYVRHGAADLGVAGKDVLLEYGGEGLYQPLDLGIGRCRMSVATRRGYDWKGTVQRGARIRVATKFIATAREHFAIKGMHVDLIHLYGSMELAPLVGLADAIVDLISTGSTLKANDLVEVETIMPISSRLIVNPAALKLKRDALKPLIDALARGGGDDGARELVTPPRLALRRLDTAFPGYDEALAELVAFEAAQDAGVDAAVATIVAEVRARGDDAVLDYTQALRQARREKRRRARDRAGRAGGGLRGDRPRATRRARRGRGAHPRIPRAPARRELDDRRRGRQRARPARDAARSVGIYVPGGKAAYPSSVLMNAHPGARSPAWREIVMVVPTPDGARNPLVLAAAHLAGVSRVFTIGGAQAIAALAYGTATIPAVDKICGPGNAYVAAAKRRVFGTVGIDMVAGRVGDPDHRRRHRQSRLGGARPLLAGRARRAGAGDPASRPMRRCSTRWRRARAPVAGDAARRDHRARRSRGAAR